MFTGGLPTRVRSLTYEELFWSQKLSLLVFISAFRLQNLLTRSELAYPFAFRATAAEHG